MFERRPRILLVDDDPLVRAAQAAALRQVGQVLIATDGADALALVSWDEDFDLVISDVDMPRVDGPTLFRLLAKGWPDLAAQLVFVTGSSSAARVDELKRLGRPVFRKPMPPEDLAALARLWVEARLAS